MIMIHVLCWPKKGSMGICMKNLYWFLLPPFVLLSDSDWTFFHGSSGHISGRLKHPSPLLLLKHSDHMDHDILSSFLTLCYILVLPLATFRQAAANING